MMRSVATKMLCVRATELCARHPVHGGKGRSVAPAGKGGQSSSQSQLVSFWSSSPLASALTWESCDEIGAGFRALHHNSMLFALRKGCREFV